MALAVLRTRQRWRRVSGQAPSSPGDGVPGGIGLPVAVLQGQQALLALCVDAATGPSAVSTSRSGSCPLRDTDFSTRLRAPRINNSVSGSSIALGTSNPLALFSLTASYLSVFAEW